MMRFVFLLKCTVASVVFFYRSDHADSWPIPLQFGREVKKDIPFLFYGTAWKKDKTYSFVLQALAEGFRAIDTANFPKHYSEAPVGKALDESFQQGLNREEVFLQTKFTPDACEGQPVLDHPYDVNASISLRVRQSFEGSLRHLGVSYVDSYILHAPFSTHEETLEAYREMEKIQSEGGARFLGVSNFNLHQLEQLNSKATVPITFIQNRCLHKYEFDRSVREFCNRNNIVYQVFDMHTVHSKFHKGYWMLTGNKMFLQNEITKDIAMKHAKTVEQVLLRFAYQGLGIIVLDGTKSISHMQEDLLVQAWSLSEEDISLLSSIIPPEYDERSPMKAFFKNNVNAPVSLFWKNPNDQSLVSQGEIQPGKDKYINTFHTHTFVVKLVEEVIMEWTADRARQGDSTVVIIDKAQSEHSEL